MKSVPLSIRIAILSLLGCSLVGFAGFLWERKSIRYQTQYDALIFPAATRFNLDPYLVRAIIWRESRFQANVRGLNKERGLMQVTPGVAEEWAQVNKKPPIDPESLFDPQTNISIGAWYLARMLHHWQETDTPAAFALAEYNAGRSNALRWVDPAQPLAANAFEQRITFPSTRRYVDTILQKYAEYRRGYFRPPWLQWWDRMLKRTDLPTVSNSETPSL